MTEALSDQYSKKRFDHALETLANILQTHLNIPTEKINLNANLVQDLGADSLDIIGILMDIEEEFDVQITDANAENMKTVEDAVKLILSVTIPS